MRQARYFVSPRADCWIVTLDGITLGRHNSQANALSSAIVMADLMGAMQHDADVMVETDGRLDLAWTFGVDPVPPRDEQAA